MPVDRKKRRVNPTPSPEGEAPNGDPPDGAPPKRNPRGTVDSEEGSNPYVTACLDAKNGFNELNRKAMLWTIRHLWPSGSRFTFNCYRQHCQLVVRYRKDECQILHSKEGVSQGDPLSAVIYGLALVPLSKFLRERHPEVIQPFFADDCSLAGPASAVRKVMQLLVLHGPSRGYFPEPSKSILVCPPRDKVAAQAILSEFNFVYEEGARYIGVRLNSLPAIRMDICDARPS